MVVDDHELFRFGLCSLLKSTAKCDQIYEAESCNEAVKILSGHASDIQYIFLDLNLSDSHGCDSIHYIKRGYPEIPIVIISASEENYLIQEALQIGVRGYITKTASNEEVAVAVQRIVQGEIYVHESALSASKTRKPVKGSVNLTDRQKQVLKLIDKGYTNFQIACHLHISENTVRVHASSIINALKAGNRTEACFLSRKLGLL
ncbi:response regulator transcription factor [Exilibacterium tricleocarpae]|uniref:Response regulator transcription factor n=1 Tax=Exilibacterium tricleocarpae TaxID=2591008 RepID=A0A545SY91_9GAMM|nr:response regulator transcription factor [Exilibacterium tricleocarpae]TQV69930.1 response regulator transcription factor [Exilibacterium tricleocarpae]